jgi:catechol 2,3-dioxygenase-like lactoylglutathione lyase family enzyme
MIGAIHHATLRVADTEEAAERWGRLLGLTGQASGGRALLRCAYEDFCLELVADGGVPGREGRSPRSREGGGPGLEHVGWELRAGVTLAAAQDHLRGAGVAAEEVEVPGRGRGLRLQDPDGNGVVLLERRVPEDRRPPVARFTDVLPAFHPRKLGHVNYLTGDVRGLVRWYAEVLGFRETDWIGKEGCWLHVSRDHHALAFLEKGYAHVHHLAFELVDWGEMRVALDHLGQHRRPLAWGPGRHAMAQNLFAYFRMPEEDLFVEFFADLEQLDEDHEVRHFPDDPHASNVWGILPPRTYFRFDDASIQVERHQLAALGRQAIGD